MSQDMGGLGEVLRRKVPRLTENKNRTHLLRSGPFSLLDYDKAPAFALVLLG